MDKAENQDQAPLLEVSQLGRQLGKRWIWRNLNFALQPGDRRGLSGPSGMGKTLFLRSLVGLDPPSEGVIRLQGQPLTVSNIPDRRSQMTLLPQRAPLWEGTVEDNLKRPFQLKGQQGKVYHREAAAHLCGQVGRSVDFLDRSSQHLSGGERQLVGILRVLLLNPQILLLDEPTVSLDQETTLQVEALIQQWYQDHPDRAYLWVSHDRAQLDRLNVNIWEMISASQEQPVCQEST
ncbi:MAG: ABC transporter ATP-binding protein [Prochlorotrichaceae cyanobacterium]